MTFELFRLPQGKILIAFSDENLSAGVLELAPKQALEKHNRPVPEELFQLKGSSVIKVFEEDGSENGVVLKEGGSLEIDPSKYHIHSNPSDLVSLTFWKLSGDVRQIIDKIRETSERLNP